MPKKKQKEEQGIPEWVVTFGDMMSLLLCLFILLQMFSELKREHEYQRVVTAVKEAFGYQGGIGVLPVDNPPLKSIIETLEEMTLKNDHDKSKISNNNDPGVDGPDTRVKKIKEGIVFTIGGPSIFDPESAEVKPAMREQLERLAKLLDGRSNEIRIVGHAAAKYPSENFKWKDLDALSYARAEAARDVLVELGIDNRMLRLVAAGTREPLSPRATGGAEASENRRVEIILTEHLVDDLSPDVNRADPSRARGG
ncbi:MAG: OmpA family protein [Planctomycetota bacterium]